MKQLKFLSYLMAALVMITTVGCDDDDDDDIDPGSTKSEMLTAGVWQGDKVYYQGTDFTDLIKNELDITKTTIKFNSNGTYRATISGEPEETGTWKFMANETQILLDEGDQDDELLVDINRFTATEIWVEGNFIDSNNDRVELRFKR
jgi:hypothetical protein